MPGTSSELDAWEVPPAIRAPCRMRSQQQLCKTPPWALVAKVADFIGVAGHYHQIGQRVAGWGSPLDFHQGKQILARIRPQRRQNIGWLGSSEQSIRVRASCRGVFLAGGMKTSLRSSQRNHRHLLRVCSRRVALLILHFITMWLVMIARH